MKRFFLSVTLIFLLLAAGINSSAQNTLCKDSLVADFVQLTRFLEETHPDPYTGFGGRYFFHKKALRIENVLRDQGADLAGFATLATEFLANIGDEHTYIAAPPMQTQVKGFAVLRARVIPDGLIISEVAEENQRLLGSRILSIEGVPVDEVLKKLVSVNACENKYGAYQKLAESVSNGQALAMLFPELGDTVTLTLRTPAGDREDVLFPLIQKEELPRKKMKTSPQTGITNGDYMFCEYVDNHRNVMLFRLASTMARENFRFTIENGWNGGVEMMETFYTRFLGKEMPSDTETALQGIPSFSETFFAMLQEMKANNSQTLIIDLRGNSGGWTPISLPSLYMLFGDDYLTADMGVEFSRMVSPLLLKKQNMTLEEFNRSQGYDYQVGDFTISKQANEVPKTNLVKVRKNFIANAMSGIKEKLEKQEGKPVYRPAKIYVVTDASTFSAAFHYSFYLWKMGATIVGVPSRQAPNTFMEGTPFQLPYTQLKGTISNSMQIFLPGTDARAKTFFPDRMPSYEDYLRYNFDLNTELLWLLDNIGSK